MESLSIGLSSSPPFPNHPKTRKFTSKSIFLLPNNLLNSIFTCNSFFRSCNSHRPYVSLTMETSFIPKSHSPNHQSNKISNNYFPNVFHNNYLVGKTPSLYPICLKSHLFFCLGLALPLPGFASETAVAADEVSNKINLEAILVSVDDFFNRNPFFVAGVTFIWLVVIPLTQEYLQKYKFISAINAFRKLRDDPNSQLLDIRDKKSLSVLGSPNLKILNKDVMQVEFREGDEESFVKQVLKSFVEPANTTVCILDNFDGNSMKAAVLLVQNGFKEAYAIRGGIRGKNGWQEIQETLLPPSVHVYQKKGVKMSQHLDVNGGVNKQSEDKNQCSSIAASGDKAEQMDNGDDNQSVDHILQKECSLRSLSPYPNYPDLKPPSSPTPSKPQQ